MDFEIKSADGVKLVLGMTVYDGSLDTVPLRVVEELRNTGSLGVKVKGKGIGWSLLRDPKKLYVDRKKAASVRMAQRQEELKGLLEKVVKKENQIRSLQAIITREQAAPTIQPVEALCPGPDNTTNPDD